MIFRKLKGFSSLSGLFVDSAEEEYLTSLQ